MKKWVSYGIICLIIPLVVIIGIFTDGNWALLSLIAAILGCIPFFIGFEKKETSTKKLIIIAIMVALSVMGRMAFAFVPSFKPITALIIITAIYFGGEAGFMVGALSAVISNFYFGQGVWTPFQMLIWGLTGFIAGLFSCALKKNKIILLIYGAVSGIIFSLLIDIWSVLWVDGIFNFSRYLALITSSLPITLIYSAANVVFLLLLTKPLGKIFGRLKTKYGI